MYEELKHNIAQDIILPLRGLQICKEIIQETRQLHFIHAKSYNSHQSYFLGWGPEDRELECRRPASLLKKQHPTILTLCPILCPVQEMSTSA